MYPLKIYTDPDQFPNCAEITIRVEDPENRYEKVGWLDAYIAPDDDFLSYMDSHCTDTGNLSFDFQKNIKKLQKVFEVTGVINISSNILFIDSIRVSPKNRKQGIGTSMINSLLNSIDLFGRPLIVLHAKPVKFANVDDRVEKEFLHDFYESFGFRRLSKKSHIMVLIPEMRQPVVDRGEFLFDLLKK